MTASAAGAGHTSGPWKVDFTLGRNVHILNEGGYSLANISYLGPYSVKTKKANARLIAAAPELLAALQDAAKVINAAHSKTLPSCFAPTLEMVNAINYAISKATVPA